VLTTDAKPGRAEGTLGCDWDAQWTLEAGEWDAFEGRRSAHKTTLANGTGQT
jgi:hypothetical protein